MVLRIALRRLAKAPAFTAFSIATLALGIGVTTAVYSALLANSHRSVGVEQPDALMTVRQVGEYSADFSANEFAEVQAGQTAFTSLVAVSRFRTGLSADGRAELVSGEAVSGEYFRALGLRPQLGRLLGPSDDRPDAPPVVVLSDVTWRRQFNRDPGVVGRTVRLSGRPYDVVGIAPRGFDGALAFGMLPAGAFTPLAVAPWSHHTPTMRDLTVMGRLGPGMTAELATARLAPIVRQLDRAAPLDRSAQHRPRQTVVSPALTPPARARADGMLVVVALPALVLLVACTNLANLVLSRNASRRHEFAVRRALGASRWTVVGEQLVEGGIVATAGGLAGIVVAARLLAFLVQVANELSVPPRPSAVFAPSMDARVLAAAGGFALLAFLIASLSPAVQLTRTSDRTMLSSDTGAGVAPRWRGRANLIALQVWVSVCLFLLTALGMRVILDENDSVDAVTATAQVAQVNVSFDEQQRDEATTRRVADRIVAALRGETAIESASLASRALGFRMTLTPPDRPLVPHVNEGEGGKMILLAPDAFRLLGISLRAGRRFDDHDAAAQAPVVILSESLARAVFRRADVVGERVFGRSVEEGPLREVDATYQIVGVATDTLTSNGRPEEVAYAPFAQHYIGDVSILAKGKRLDVDETLTMLRTAVRTADPDLALSFAGRADPDRWVRAAGMRYLTGSGAALAVLALILAMTGLYGVLSHVVARRTREIGLRMALGADRGRIISLVLGNGFRPVIEGLVLGTISAMILRLLLQPVFKNPVTGFDPVAVALAAGPLLLAAGLACYLPARRAARVEPNVALRDL